MSLKADPMRSLSATVLRRGCAEVHIQGVAIRN